MTTIHQPVDDPEDRELKVLSIDGWRAGIRFSSCHIIPHHHKCSRMHGHTYVLHLKIHGRPDDSGFLMDFSVIKRAMEEIAAYLDHRVLLPGRNPHIEVEQTGGERGERSEGNEGSAGGQIRVSYQHKRYEFPSEDVLILDLVSLTAEILSHYVLEEFLKRVEIPGNIVSISAGIDEGPGQGAWSSRKLR